MCVSVAAEFKVRPDSRTLGVESWYSFRGFRLCLVSFCNSWQPMVYLTLFLVPLPWTKDLKTLNLGTPEKGYGMIHVHSPAATGGSPN